MVKINLRQVDNELRFIANQLKALKGPAEPFCGSVVYESRAVKRVVKRYEIIGDRSHVIEQLERNSAELKAYKQSFEAKNPLIAA